MFRSLHFVKLILVIGCVAVGREIPLSEISSTVRQDGVQYVGSGRRIVDKKTVEADYAVAMDGLLRDRNGASNAFVVAGETINDAIKATQLVFDGNRTADIPVLPIGVKSRNYWAAVYLGCGHSEPRKWIMESATHTGNTIRLSYRRPKTTVQTEDLVRYYYWVPLGSLDAGTYNLELYDAGLKSVTLMRRVEIKER